MLSRYFTRRNVTLFATNSSLAFASISGLVQLVLAVYPLGALHGGRALFAIIAISASFGVLKSLPRTAIGRNFRDPYFKISIKKGDLFDESSHLVVGFTDTFDTDSFDSEIISPGSVQGQFLQKVYAGDLSALDRDLEEALRGCEVGAVEPVQEKVKGKLIRYPMGTVVVLGRSETRHYCVAYSRMGNNLVAQSSVDALWISLSALWNVIDDTGHRGRVSIPIIGSELARVDNLGYQEIARMIILSFVARSRESLVARELTLIVHPQDSARIDMNEMDFFLNSL
ncbi:macro domain-containing protein [Streptomyces sp. NPDC059766]|uniref:macro domain-containing protein n=1 Tax=Streptomyces sp. NPDC059766 TaxID=3346940 RepID=UPI0036658F1F